MSHTFLQPRLACLPLLIAVALTLTSCGNTIRGIGNDVGNVVDATQDAGRSVARSAR